MSHGTYIYILIILFFPISRLYRPTFYYHSKLSITWILKKSLLLIEAKLLGPLVIPRPSFSCSAALEATRCIDDASTLLTPISLSRDFHGPRVSIRVFTLRLIYTSIDPPAPSVAASINHPLRAGVYLKKILIKRSSIARGGGGGEEGEKGKNMAKYSLENSRCID